MARWWWRADYLESCNCAHGCPCNTTQLPTDGTCQAMTAWRIREGLYESTRLDSLVLGMLVRWPNPIHRGNGRGILYLDERANPAQRAALEKIGRGEAGEGGPFAIFAATFSESPKAIFGPIEFWHDESTARLRFGDLAEMEMGPIRGDMDGSPANVHLVMPTGFIFRDARMLNSQRCEVRAPGLSFSHRGSNAFISRVEYNV